MTPQISDDDQITLHIHPSVTSVSDRARTVNLGTLGSFTLALAEKAEPDVEAYLTRQIRFDPDLWIVEVEDRAGRHFLDHLVR